MLEIKENDKIKTASSISYNYVFNKENGFFARWGKSESDKDDPTYSPYGPEILDIEIASGDCSGKCKFCYKDNSNREPEYMSLDTFKRIFSTFNKSLTQIAFGITDIYSNPDFFDILKYCRENGVIPNYTTNANQLDDNAVDLTAKLCGAVAVSLYDKDKCYDAIKRFTDAGMKQVNIHFMLAEQTVNMALSVIDDIKDDPRLAKLNAIVFLQYKHKNIKSPYSSISSIDTYKKVINKCQEKQINYGFDSCSAPLFFKASSDPDVAKLCGEPCESGLFSGYINTKGKFFPCSFTEEGDGWEHGIDVTKIKDFTKEVWDSPRVERWREALMVTSSNCDCEFTKWCRSCPVYNISSCKVV